MKNDTFLRKNTLILQIHFMTKHMSHYNLKIFKFVLMRIRLRNTFQKSISSAISKTKNSI